MDLKFKFKMLFDDRVTASVMVGRYDTVNNYLFEISLNNGCVIYCHTLTQRRSTDCVYCLNNNELICVIPYSTINNLNIVYKEEKNG